MRRLLAALALLVLLWPGRAHAIEGADCLTTYYRTKDATCVDQLAARLQKTPQTDRSIADLQGAIGFLAKLFAASPEVRDRALAQDAPAQVKTVYLIALVRSGLPDEPRRYAERNGLSAALTRLEARRLPALDQVKPSSYPGDNDLLIGAYMASGETRYVKTILANYAGAGDGMARDGLRMGFLLGKFGAGFEPPGRERVTAKAACERYGCKADMTQMMRVMTLSSALWALHSLARADDGVKTTMAASFRDDPRLRRLFVEEGQAFANYLTLLAASAVKKDDPALNAALSAYEGLEPAQHAFGPLQRNK